jgi:hypothetical protein
LHGVDRSHSTFVRGEGRYFMFLAEDADAAITTSD